MPQRHIQKFSSADAIQSALNAGELGNPYVAFDQSAHTLDINTLYPIVVETRVKATYLFESTSPTVILNGNPNEVFSKAEFEDGTEITLTGDEYSTYYTPSQTGLTDIYFTPTGTSLATSIGLGVFNDISELGGKAKLVNVVLPDQITDFGDMAFMGCINLSAVTLPSGITSIPDQMFTNCEHLTPYELPATVTSIGRMAFAIGLAMEITIRQTTPPYFEDNSFDTGWYTTFYVPEGSTSDYEMALENAGYSIGGNVEVQAIQ